ncbi:1,4-dihydroxy-6-naphthoate synthase [Paenibacillus sp. GCM10027628]|uniref:1,4-dihydroxy-6-naphthoate synthase n=1 Tax=Paenibacillus sp. GCM10027628 TaxID=3273413 RepID=UPI003627D3F7
MSHYDNLYCKLFIHTDMDKNSLVGLVCSIVTGTKEATRTIVTDFSEIDILKNEDFDIEKTNNRDGFLFYRYYLDIEPRNHADKDEKKYMSSVAELLQCLWDLGFNAVCACDFEGELPNIGGNIPD